MQRIKASLEKINSLMSELKAKGKNLSLVLETYNKKGLTFVRPFSILKALY